MTMLATTNAAGIGMELLDSDGNGMSFQGPFPDDMTISTAWPGGCSSCRFSVKRPVLLSYPDLQFATEIILSDGQGPFWRGRIERFRPSVDQKSESIEVEALQVNADDQEIATITFTATTAIETLVDSVRSTYMPKVGSSNLYATGRNLAANLTLTDTTAMNALNRLCELGDSSNNTLGWGVWPDGAAGAYQLQLAVRPSTPDYHVDINDVRLTLGFDGAGYANRQRIRYNGGASTLTVDNATAQGALPGGVNLVRAGKLLTRNDITSATDATAIAQAALNLSSQLRVNAERADLTASAAIRAIKGDSMLAVPLWRVRAGKALAIDGMLPGAVVGTYTLGSNLAFIVGTQYDTAKRSLTLTFESFQQTLQGVIGSLYRK